MVQETNFWTKIFSKKGLEKRRETLGAEYVDRTLAAADDFNRPFQEAMTPSTPKPDP
jgi:hypothetical protein